MRQIFPLKNKELRKLKRFFNKMVRWASVRPPKCSPASYQPNSLCAGAKRASSRHISIKGGLVASTLTDQARQDRFRSSPPPLRVAKANKLLPARLIVTLRGFVCVVGIWTSVFITFCCVLSSTSATAHLWITTVKFFSPLSSVKIFFFQASCMSWSVQDLTNTFSTLFLKQVSISINQ